MIRAIRQFGSRIRGSDPVPSARLDTVHERPQHGYPPPIMLILGDDIGCAAWAFTQRLDEVGTPSPPTDEP